MTTTGLSNDVSLDVAADLAAQLRVDSIRSSTSAGSGHPTSSMSAADLLAVLVTRHLRYDWALPHSPVNDHLIFSKGHASPLLYSIFKAVGVVSEEELLNGYRRFGERLEGHPTPILPWVDVATGSLGQGLPDGVGVALAGRCSPPGNATSGSSGSPSARCPAQVPAPNSSPGRASTPSTSPTPPVSSLAASKSLDRGARRPGPRAASMPHAFR